LFAVAEAEQEDEAVKVGSELVDVVAAIPDEGGESNQSRRAFAVAQRRTVTRREHQIARILAR
jgi:hypothetical protein